MEALRQLSIGIEDFLQYRLFDLFRQLKASYRWQLSFAVKLFEIGRSVCSWSGHLIYAY